MLQPRPDLVWTKVPLDIATFGLRFEIQITLDTQRSELSDFDYTVFLRILSRWMSRWHQADWTICWPSLEVHKVSEVCQQGAVNE